MPLIEVRNATFSYGNKNIFKDINFKLKKGEILCLLGPNGCGKTTFLDCLLGLNKLKQGAICLRGKNINTLKPQQIAKNIAYVPQMHNRTFPYRVIDIVLMGRAAHTSMFSSPNSDDLAIAEEALDLVGISEFKNRIYTQLSGGEGQLVMIARALAQKTPVIILDEPTAHLDFMHELKILETIVRLVNETKLTIIMATHFPNHAFYLENNSTNTTVAMINKGHFAAVGRPSQVLSEENMKFIFNIDSKILSYTDYKEEKLSYIIPLNTLSKAR